jgi:starch synthase
MHIVFAASECAPYVKTGGLADVVDALPREIVRLGHQVTVYLPYYRQVAARVPDKKAVIRSITIPFRSYSRFVTILDGGKHDGVQIYFVDCPELFDREYIYATPTGDYGDNWERFGLFSRAVLEAGKQIAVPDIFHLHNWQSSIISVYLRTLYATDPVYSSVGTILTIHNAGYQGLFPPVTVENLLFPWDIFRLDRVEHYDNFNFLKGGIVYSDAITTVSRKYAEEIQTPEFGNSLDAAIRRRAGDLHGILNGVDYSKWNPATDHNIAAHYTPENLAGKADCRRDLLHAFGAGQISETTPVLGIVSRFATMKGFDLIAAIADQLMQEDVVLVALGTGEPYYENLFRTLQERFPAKVFVRVLFDEALAHKVEAGSDIFLMPSRYEPCGLNQIYSLKYGTVPVVRATGGLDDTISEWNAETRTGTGFKFHGERPEDFLGTIRHAIDVFRDKDTWQTLMRNGMAQDFSWAKPAEEYLKLYKEVARRRS